jgi:crotonobetainyl-CoA:carnitine CoA-transferase CaiB-like acyl-CoA transferase
VALARLTVEEVLRRAAAAGIPAVRARQARELTGDDQLIRHGLLAVAGRDDAGVTAVLPGRWLEQPGLVTGPPGPAPAAGQHAAAILAEAATENNAAIESDAGEAAIESDADAHA